MPDIIPAATALCEAEQLRQDISKAAYPDPEIQKTVELWADSRNALGGLTSALNILCSDAKPYPLSGKDRGSLNAVGLIGHMLTETLAGDDIRLRLQNIFDGLHARFPDDSMPRMRFRSWERRISEIAAK